MFIIKNLWIQHGQTVVLVLPCLCLLLSGRIVLHILVISPKQFNKTHKTKTDNLLSITNFIWCHPLLDQWIFQRLEMTEDDIKSICHILIRHTRHNDSKTLTVSSHCSTMQVYMLDHTEASHSQQTVTLEEQNFQYNRLLSCRDASLDTWDYCTYLRDASLNVLDWRDASLNFLYFRNCCQNYTQIHLKSKLKVAISLYN